MVHNSWALLENVKTNLKILSILNQMMLKRWRKPFVWFNPLLKFSIKEFVTGKIKPQKSTNLFN